MRKILIKTSVLGALAAAMMTMTAAAAVVGTGVVDADSLRVRSEPNTKCSTLTYLIDGTKVRVHEVLDGWYKVSYGETTGYVSADYLVYTPTSVEEEKAEEAKPVEEKAEETKQGIVTGSCVNVRSGPSTDHSILTRLYSGNKVELLQEQDGWYAVRFDDVEGYMSADYVREYTGTTASSIGEEVVAKALSYLGTPYVYGGASSKGFDCSGFTMYIYGKFGYSFPHSATSQWNSCSTYVEKSDLQPGDLVLFCDPSRSNGKACSHVGIYIGGGEFVHASSGSSGKYVRISSLSEGYYSTYYKGAKRIG